MNNLQVASVTLLDAVKRASAERASLNAATKRGVFSEWARVCLGRVHNADIKEQRKGWMIDDILRARYGQLIADAAQSGRLNA